MRLFNYREILMGQQLWKEYPDPPWSVPIQGEIQKQLAEQKEQMYKVSDFIKACRVIQEKVSTDIQVLREHCQKYGYQPPQDTQRKTSK